ncbi:hypothetical protein I7I48_06151 [Histoplasma ohiense]|nr:hypothetical protein I7I48_06151 [Histoplasma ohiense (nom. inval.)]
MHTHLSYSNSRKLDMAPIEGLSCSYNLDCLLAGLRANQPENPRLSMNLELIISSLKLTECAGVVPWWTSCPFSIFAAWLGGFLFSFSSPSTTTSTAFLRASTASGSASFCEVLLARGSIKSKSLCAYTLASTSNPAPPRGLLLKSTFLST